MTGPEHYIEAERLAAFAEETYLDTSQEPGPREDYASEAQFSAAVAEGNEAHELNIIAMSAFSQMAQAHATLALTVATLEAGGVTTGHGSGLRRDAWESAVLGADAAEE